VASSIKQPSLFPILLVNFVGTVGFSIVLPFLVFLVMKFGGDAITYGLLAATYPAFQLVGAPLLGRWSDTFGRKRVLLLSNVGTSIGWILFLYAIFLPAEKSFTANIAFIGTFIISVPLFMLFLARAIDGVTGGNISIAYAYLADLSTDNTRSKNFGKMAISSNLGFIIGPAIAGILGGTIYGEILPVLAALILSVVTVIVIIFLLKESKPLSKEISIPVDGTVRRVFAQECKDCYSTVGINKPRFQDVFKLEYVSFLLVVYFLIFLGFNIYYAAFPTHAANDLKWSVTQLGIYYAVLGGVMAFVQGPILRKALKKTSEEKLVVIGSLILGAGFVLYVSNNIVWVSGALILFAIGNGLMWPSFMSILSRRAGSKLQGTVQGIAGSFGGLASIIGLILGGFLYTSIGGATFLISAGIILAIFVMSFRLLVKKAV
jgi:MFS transporter, DHA1 family, tetracycline resistance protein